MSLPAASNAAHLLLSLKSEIETVSLFVSLLRQEQVALSLGHTSELPTLIEQKNLLAEQLGNLATRRNALLAEQEFSADRPGIEAWCARHPLEKGVAEAWAKILTLATEAKELNRLNGDLIALRMRHNALALEALRGGDQTLSLYGPDGQSMPPGSRRINDSV